GRYLGQVAKVHVAHVKFSRQKLVELRRRRGERELVDARYVRLLSTRVLVVSDEVGGVGRRIERLNLEGTVDHLPQRVTSVGRQGTRLGVQELVDRLRVGRIGETNDRPVGTCLRPRLRWQGLEGSQLVQLDEWLVVGL